MNQLVVNQLVKKNGKVILCPCLVHYLSIVHALPIALIVLKVLCPYIYPPKSLRRALVAPFSSSFMGSGVDLFFP